MAGRLVAPGAGGSIAIINERVNVSDYGASPSATAAQNAAGIQAALDHAGTAIGAKGGKLTGPPGVYLTDTQLNAPGGVCFDGGGALDYILVADAPARGMVLRAAAPMAAVLRLGTLNSNSTSSGDVSATALGLVVDAAGVADRAIRTYSRRCYIRNCQAWRGLLHAVHLEGQNSHLLDSVCGNNNVGSTVYATGADAKVRGCQIRQGALAQLLIEGVAAEIEHNHIFGGFSGGLAGTTGDNILIRWATTSQGNWLIANNMLDGTMGHMVRLVVEGTNTVLCNLNVHGNNSYQLDVTDNTYSFVYVDVTASGAVLRGLNVHGNQFFNPDNTRYLKALVEKAGGGTIEASSVMGNTGSFVNAICSGFRPDFNWGNALKSSGGVMLRSNNSGKATPSGNGSATAFTIAHGLGGTPNHQIVTPGSADAKGDFYVTADATNLTVTYGTAPASGTNNVVLNWDARL